jgi:ABC-type transport system involved in multi-copper enzyme maturation permease subunit
MTGATFVPLLRHAWARHKVVFLVTALALGAFQFLGTRLAPAPNETNWMASMIATLPAGMRALIGNEFAVTLPGFLAIGYAHPFFMILLSAWIVRVTSGAIAGEIGHGTIDLLASRPVPRWHLAAAAATAASGGVAAIVLTAWLGTYIGLATRPLGVGAAEFWPVVVTAWLLFTAWSGVGLLVSATRRDGGSAIAWTTTFLAVSFVLDYLARLWAPISGLRPFSLFRHYQPQALLTSGLAPLSAIVLAGTAIAGLAAAILVLHRRDL